MKSIDMGIFFTLASHPTLYSVWIAPVLSVWTSPTIDQYLTTLGVAVDMRLRDWIVAAESDEMRRSLDIFNYRSTWPLPHYTPTFFPLLRSDATQTQHEDERGISYLYGNLLSVHVNEFHVHRVYGGEDIGCSLYDTFPCLGHRDRCACCDKYWLITTTKRQIREIMTLDENNFLITESHLSSGIPANE